MINDHTWTNTNTCAFGIDKTIDVADKTEIDSEAEEVINLDSQPSPKASPVDSSSPPKYVDLCDDTPLKPLRPRVNLDDFRFDDSHMMMDNYEGKGSSFSKQSVQSMIS